MVQPILIHSNIVSSISLQTNTSKCPPQSIPKITRYDFDVCTKKRLERIGSKIPAGTRRSYNVALKSRRYIDVIATLYKRHVPAGPASILSIIIEPSYDVSQRVTKFDLAMYLFLQYLYCRSKKKKKKKKKKSLIITFFYYAKNTYLMTNFWQNSWHWTC